MEIEKDMLFLLALVAGGAALASGLAATLQWIIVLPLTLLAIFLMVLVYMQYNKKAIHFSEKLETWAFIIAVLLFAVSFIYLFKPA